MPSENNFMIKRAGFIFVLFNAAASFASDGPATQPHASPAPVAQPAPTAPTQAPPSALRNAKENSSEVSKEAPKEVVKESPKEAVKEKAPAPAPVASVTKEQAPAKPKPLMVSDEQRDFDRAAELMKNGKEAEAIVSAADFLRRYPTSRLASEAQYLMGELFFRQRKFKEAAGEFSKVHRFGILGVDKASWASVKMGECWYQLKMFEQARIEWEAVRRKFPNSEAAEAARSRLAGIPL